MVLIRTLKGKTQLKRGIMRNHNMKHMKRANIYKGWNVTFNPETMDARSHGWWQFVSIEGCKKSLNEDGTVVVFNHHGYSSSTQNHQRKVRSLLNELGIKIDIEVDIHLSLDNDLWQMTCVQNAQRDIDELKRKEAKGRKGTQASEWRLKDIAKYQQMIKDVKQLT